MIVTERMDIATALGRAGVRDRYRVALYAHKWWATCQEAMKLIQGVTEDPSSPFDIILPLARNWLLLLDTMVTPIVEEQRVAQQRAATETIEGSTTMDSAVVQKLKDLQEGKLSTTQSVIYTNYERRKLTPWASKVGSTYPFLKQIMTTYLSHQLNNLAKCCQRLVQDWPRILQRSNLGLSLHELTTSVVGDIHTPMPLQLEAIETTDSDSHCDGQAVLLLRFNGNRRLLYKPFGGRCAQLFDQFRVLLNRVDPTIDVRTMNVLLSSSLSHPSTSIAPVDEMHSYYWAEYIAVHDCKDAHDVSAFYRRAGLLVGICEALGFSDGHRSNLIAAGAHPVLVDCETLFQPQPLTSSPHTTKRLLETLLLQEAPTPFSASQNEWIAAFQQADAPPSPSTSAARRPSSSIPRVDGKAQYLRHHIEPFMNGYTVAQNGIQRLLTLHGHDMSIPSDATDGIGHELKCWFDGMKTVTTRLVLRPTSFYTSVCLPSLRTPESLASLSRAEANIHGLLQHQSGIGAMEAVRTAEAKDLLQYDVPAFYSRQRDVSIYDAHGGVVMPLENSIPFSINHIIACVFPAAMESRHRLLRSSASILLADPCTDAHITRSTYRDGAIFIGQRILAFLAANHLNGTSDSGSEAAVTAVLPAERKVWQYGDVYSGASGLLIFLSGLACIQEPSHKTQMVSMLHVLVKQILQYHTVPRHRCGGAFSSVAGDAYALILAGRFVGNEEWQLEAAHLCRRFITIDEINSDFRNDILTGLQGCVLVLLAVRSALEQSTNPSTHQQRMELMAHLLSTATHCGHVLWKRVCRAQDGTPLGWPMDAPRPPPVVMLTTTVAAPTSETAVDSKLPIDKAVAAPVPVHDSSVDAPVAPLTSTAAAAPASSYPKFTDLILTGMAHGNAGAVLALRRLSATTNDPQFCEAAKQLAKAEDAHYVPHLHNWPKANDHSVPGPVPFGWCYGLPGIALSRQSCACPSSPSSSSNATTSSSHKRCQCRIAMPLHCNVRSELLTHIGTVAIPSMNMALCCGTPSVLDIAMELTNGDTEMNEEKSSVDAATSISSSTTASVDPLQLALDTLAQKLVKKIQAEDISCFRPENQRFGLMKGIAGVGYTFLRLYEPTRFPSLLATNI